jgi:hypothetical protein
MTPLNHQALAPALRSLAPLPVPDPPLANLANRPPPLSAHDPAAGLEPESSSSISSIPAPVTSSTSSTSSTGRASAATEKAKADEIRLARSVLLGVWKGSAQSGVGGVSQGEVGDGGLANDSGKREVGEKHDLSDTTYGKKHLFISPTDLPFPVCVWSGGGVGAGVKFVLRSCSSVKGSYGNI